MIDFLLNINLTNQCLDETALPRKKTLKEAKEQVKNKTNTKQEQTASQKQKSQLEENPTVAKQSSINHRKG